MEPFSSVSELVQQPSVRYFTYDINALLAKFISFKGIFDIAQPKADLFFYHYISIYVKIRSGHPFQCAKHSLYCTFVRFSSSFVFQKFRSNHTLPYLKSFCPTIFESFLLSE